MNAVAADLTLASLLEHDPGDASRYGESRYLCPLPRCVDHQDPRQHRSLSVSDETGKWCCFRCNSAGTLSEFARGEQSNRVRLSRQERERRRTSAFFEIPDRSKAAVDPNKLRRVGDRLCGIRSLEQTPGAAYLESRGISAALAGLHGARFHADWYGRAAVVFGVRDGDGETVAAGSRCVDGREPKAPSAGAIRAGVYSTKDALDADVLAFCEAPIDALSLAICGLPSIATCGASAGPAWLVQRLAFRTVIIATDADDRGNEAAAEIAKALAIGTRCERLILPPGIKDCNAWLTADGEGMRAAVAAIAARHHGRALPAAAPSIAPPVAAPACAFHVGKPGDDCRRCRVAWRDHFSRWDLGAAFNTSTHT